MSRWWFQRDLQDKIRDAQFIGVGPDTKLIASFDGPLTQDQAARIRETLVKRLPEFEDIIIVSDGARFLAIGPKAAS